jgi:hypothetical protein
MGCSIAISSFPPTTPLSTCFHTLRTHTRTRSLVVNNTRVVTRAPQARRHGRGVGCSSSRERRRGRGVHTHTHTPRSLFSFSRSLVTFLSIYIYIPPFVETDAERPAANHMYIRRDLLHVKRDLQYVSKKNHIHGVPAYKRSRTHAYTQTHTHTYMHTCMHTYIHATAYIHAQMQGGPDFLTRSLMPSAQSRVQARLSLDT